MLGSPWAAPDTATFQFPALRRQCREESAHQFSFHEERPTRPASLPRGASSASGFSGSRRTTPRLNTRTLYYRGAAYAYSISILTESPRSRNREKSVGARNCSTWNNICLPAGRWKSFRMWKSIRNSEPKEEKRISGDPSKRTKPFPPLGHPASGGPPGNSAPSKGLPPARCPPTASFSQLSARFFRIASPFVSPPYHPKYLNADSNPQ